MVVNFRMYISVSRSVYIQWLQNHTDAGKTCSTESSTVVKVVEIRATL